MYISIHDEASIRFNQQAMELVSLIKPAPPKVSVSTFSPEHHISGTIEGDDLIEVTALAEVNQLGEEISKHFIHDEKLYGLLDEGYQSLYRLSESIYRHGKVNQYLSVAYIIDSLFEWVRKQWIAESKTSFIEDLLVSAEADIVEQDIGFPISMLSVEDELVIGAVVFKPITKDRFNKWFQNALEANRDNLEVVTEYIEKYRKKTQGNTIAEITILAEDEHAIKIAKEKVLKSLSILRVFSPSNLHPKLTEGFNILGSERNDRVNCQFYKEGVVDRTLEYLEHSYKLRTISKQDMEETRRLGLDIINDVLIKSKKSEFQEKVLDALDLYSKSTMLPGPEDKLIYILSAIESMLLKDTGEPIQKNLGERMAFFVGKTPEERIAIKADVENIYNIRSKFLHHGYTIEESEMLAGFMRTAWNFIIKLIGEINKYNTKLEFIEHFEKIKFR